MLNIKLKKKFDFDQSKRSADTISVLENIYFN